MNKFNLISTEQKSLPMTCSWHVGYRSNFVDAITPINGVKGS